LCTFYGQGANISFPHAIPSFLVNEIDDWKKGTNILSSAIFHFKNLAKSPHSFASAGTHCPAFIRWLALLIHDAYSGDSFDSTNIL